MLMKNKFIGMTLVELIVGLVLLSIIVLGLSQIDLFSRSQVLRTDRQAVLQNELSLILNHMDKTGMRAVGNERINGVNDSVVRHAEDNKTIDVRFYVDGNNDGIYQNNGINPDITVDHAIVYQLGINPGGGALGPVGYAARYNLRYCPLCRDMFSCNRNNQCNGSGWEVLGTRIANFTISKPADTLLTDNYVYIEMTACWDPGAPAGPDQCGTTLNPQVTMHTVINFPMVSTN